MQKDDVILIEEYLSGNEASFELLVDRYLNHIYNFVLKSINNRDESHDITQQIFLKVWKNIKKFDRERNFKTWLFTIARNTIIDWYKKKKHISFSSLDTEDVVFEETLVDTEPLPDELFSQKELGQSIENALSFLKKEDKQIIILHHSEGLIFEDIAEVLGRPMNTVKSQYRRALMKLREYLINPLKH